MKKPLIVDAEFRVVRSTRPFPTKRNSIWKGWRAELRSTILILLLAGPMWLVSYVLTALVVLVFHR